MHEESEKVMSLNMVDSGVWVKYVGVDAGSALRSRLASMGLVPGVRLQVIRNSLRGPFIIMVKETRLMLGRGIANKIMVA